MNASQQDILDKINTAEVEIILRLNLFFPSVEWNFPLSNRLLLLCLPVRRHKERQRSHHLSHGHQDEVLTQANLEVSIYRWIGLANSSDIDSTGDSMGMGVQAGQQTLSFEALLLDVLANSSIWPSEISTAASVMRWPFDNHSCYSTGLMQAVW